MLGTLPQSRVITVRPLPGADSAMDGAIAMKAASPAKARVRMVNHPRQKAQKSAENSSLV
jgi:hypothetical protein